MQKNETNLEHVVQFETEREFENKFPSKLYICSKCDLLTPDPNYCINCKNQSNNLFNKNTYTYTIAETNTTQTIFKPLEMENT